MMNEQCLFNFILVHLIGLMPPKPQVVLRLKGTQDQTP